MKRTSMKGGSMRKMKKSHNGGKKGGKSRRNHTRKQKGGMMGALSAMARTALVPFGLLAAQKMLQRTKKSRK